MSIQVSAATDPGSDAPNEDYFLVSSAWGIVLDGITRYPDDGCIHDVRWYVSQLGTRLSERIGNTEVPLQAVLAESIEATTNCHRVTCDVENRVSPGSTVSLVRWSNSTVEWLILGDCTIAWFDHDRKSHSETDDRLERLQNPPAPTDVAGVKRLPVEYVSQVRNRPGGFWVASTSPEVAAYAYTGTIPRFHLSGVMLCTDGFARLEERYHHSWMEIFDNASECGIAELIHSLREFETRDPSLRLRAKRHDDATGVLIRFQ